MKPIAILPTSMAIAVLNVGCVTGDATTPPAMVSLTMPEPTRVPSALVVAGPGPLRPPGSVATSVTELACAQEKELRSAVSEESLELDFQNATDRPLTLEWLDFNGRRVRYAAVKPGESYRQQTYVTHPWVAVDAEGKCLRVFVPRAAGLYTVRILGPDQRATTRWK